MKIMVSLRWKILSQGYTKGIALWCVHLNANFSNRAQVKLESKPGKNFQLSVPHKQVLLQNSGIQTTRIAWSLLQTVGPMHKTTCSSTLATSRTPVVTRLSMLLAAMLTKATLVYNTLARVVHQLLQTKLSSPLQ